MKKINILKFYLLIIFCVIFLFSGFQLYKIILEYRIAENTYKDLMKFEPQESNSYSNNESNTSHNNNAKLVQLIKEYPDVCGWISLDNTNINYPFVKSKNNSKYLRQSLDGNYLISGTLFLDYRCKKNLNSFNSIIFGHNMKNGMMFADLIKFSNKEYFYNNGSGNIYTENTTYKIEVIAYLLVSSNDSVIYDPYVKKVDFIKYINDNAIYLKKIDVEDDETVISLSTCSYDFPDARHVVIAKLISK